MAIYPPDDPANSAALRARLKPVYGYKADYIEMVKRTASESGKSQIRDVWGRTRFIADCPHEVRKDDAELLMAFWRANRVLAFDFFDALEGYFPDESIGTGTGAETTFTVPAKETSDRVVKVAGVTKTEGVHYNISVGTGAVGQDRIIFTGGNIPANGAAITMTYRGRHWFTMEFVDLPVREAKSFAITSVRFMMRERF